MVFPHLGRTDPNVIFLWKQIDRKRWEKEKDGTGKCAGEKEKVEIWLLQEFPGEFLCKALDSEGGRLTMATSILVT